MLDSLKHPAVFLLVAVSVFGLKYCFDRSLGHWPERFIRVAASGLIVAYLGLMLVYLIKPGYWDPIEPSVTAVAQQLLHGRQIYHALDAAPRFSLLYGPSVFAGNALLLSMVDSPILASKLVGTICAVLALIALYRVLCREFERRWVYVGLGQFVVFALWQEHYTYWNRADSLLLLCTSLGWLSVLSQRKWLRWLGLSLAMGVAINTKIHAPLFFLPLLALLCLRRGYRDCVPPLALAVVWIVLPFVLFPQLFSLPNYLTWLTDVGSLPLSVTLLARNGEYALLMIVWPIALIGVVAVHRARRRLRLVWPIAVAVACALVIAVIGAHPAAGPHHLIPLMPSMVYLTINLYVRIRDELRPAPAWPKLRAAALAILTPAWMLAAAAAIVIGQIEIVFYDFVLPDEGSIQTDLLKVKAAHADSSLQMGYGDTASHRATYFRPWLYTGQTEYLLDSMAMMDMQSVGVAIPPATLAVFTSQRFDIWLIPRSNEPFSMSSIWFESQPPLFSAELQSAFRENYYKAGNSEFFDVWQAKRLIAQ